MIDLSRDGDIHLITMNHQQNQVDPDFLRAIHAALDEVESTDSDAVWMVAVALLALTALGLGTGLLVTARRRSSEDVA